MQRGGLIIDLISMGDDIHCFTLNTGAAMPAVGLGTWQSPTGEIGAAVVAAVKVIVPMCHVLLFLMAKIAANRSPFWLALLLIILFYVYVFFFFCLFGLCVYIYMCVYII